MRRWIGCFFLALMLGCGLQARSETYERFPYCPILDAPSRPLYEVNLAFLPKERLEGYGRGSFAEFDADRALAYFRGILWGDLDLNSRLRTTLMFDSAGLNLPDQLVELSLDMTWTHRQPGGTAFQVGARPGLYSDVEELSTDGLLFPFRLAVIQSFSDQVAGLAGFEIRPEFDRVVRPEVMLVWQPSALLRLQAGLPESKADWALNRLWSLHAGFVWRNTSYALRPDAELEREQMTWEDYRLYAGASRAISDEARFVCQLGQVVERSISFDRAPEGSPREVDIENGWFVRFGVVGPF